VAHGSTPSASLLSGTDSAPVHFPVYTSSLPATRFALLLAMTAFARHKHFEALCLTPEKIGKGIH
jgi:hypothetical protein